MAPPSWPLPCDGAADLRPCAPTLRSACGRLAVGLLFSDLYHHYSDSSAYTPDQVARRLCDQLHTPCPMHLFFVCILSPIYADVPYPPSTVPDQQSLLGQVAILNYYYKSKYCSIFITMR
jgi:hypothetical protein